MGKAWVHVSMRVHQLCIFLTLKAHMGVQAISQVSSQMIMA